MLLMTVTMKQVSVTSLLLILGIVCSATGTLDDSAPCDFRCFFIGEPHCIPQVWLCDAYHDCDNGTDEDPHLCQVQMTRDCPSNYTRCEGESPSIWCIRSFRLCDGRDDCGNNWDEDATMCAEHTCELNRYRCANDRCVPQEWICDATDDCGDSSDEQNCLAHVCGPDQFQCADTGQCIPSIWRCNGHDNCEDSSDEQNCDEITCGPHQFMCAYARPNVNQRWLRHCIPSEWICDGDNDCGDLSDEENCGSKKMKKKTPLKLMNKVFRSLF